LVTSDKIVTKPPLYVNFCPLVSGGKYTIFPISPVCQFSPLPCSGCCRLHRSPRPPLPGVRQPVTQSGHHPPRLHRSPRPNRTETNSINSKKAIYCSFFLSLFIYTIFFSLFKKGKCFFACRFASTINWCYLL